MGWEQGHQGAGELGGWEGRGIHLTKGQPAQSSTKLGHEMPLLGWGVGVLVGLGAGGTSDQRSACL